MLFSTLYPTHNTGHCVLISSGVHATFLDGAGQKALGQVYTHLMFY